MKEEQSYADNLQKKSFFKMHLKGLSNLPLNSNKVVYDYFLEDFSQTLLF